MSRISEAVKLRAWDKYYRIIGIGPDKPLPISFPRHRVHNDEAQMAGVYYCREGHLHFPEVPLPCTVEDANV